MATPLDLLLIDGYTAGTNIPLLAQAGFEAVANREGTNIEYIGPQVAAGSATWDGLARQVLVGGTGARSIVLKNGYFLGQTVEVVDAAANAGSGTITVSVSEGAIAGSLTITADGESRRYMYVSAAQWRRVQG